MTIPQHSHRQKRTPPKWVKRRKRPEKPKQPQRADFKDLLNLMVKVFKHDD